jgi:hypothetical protein
MRKWAFKLEMRPLVEMWDLKGRTLRVKETEQQQLCIRLLLTFINSIFYVAK